WEGRDSREGQGLDRARRTPLRRAACRGRSLRCSTIERRAALILARRGGRAPRLLLEALNEPLEQPDPDLVLADRVLDAVLEVGIVIDLHDHEAAVGLLDVDPVESLADRLGGARGDVEQLLGRLVELEGAEAALARRAVGAVLDDLPMAARHAGLAHQQRLPPGHRPPPGALRR